MIFRKIKKTYRKYFREKKIIKKEKLKDKSLEILFFYTISICFTMHIHDEYSQKHRGAYSIHDNALVVAAIRKESCTCTSSKDEK